MHVELFNGIKIRAVCGENIPVIESAVFQGRATVRPIMNIPLPARFIFVHNAGKDYRHYIEATWFGIPFMKVNERYLDGTSLFELPVIGTINNDPATNQAANLAAGDPGERHRLIGAYQGIALGMASRTADRFEAGGVRSLVWRHADGSVVLSTLRDGYYLVVALGPGSLPAVAVRHCEEARARLDEEI